MGVSRDRDLSSAEEAQMFSRPTARRAALLVAVAALAIVPLVPAGAAESQTGGSRGRLHD